MLRTLWFIWRHPLSARHRFAAFARYFRWQIGSRILGMPVIVPFIDGTNLVVEPGMTGATGNIYCGLHEFTDMVFVLHFLRKQDLFVDVGANVGSYSLLAAGIVGARSIAVEPVPSTFKRLLRNVRSNDLVTLVDARPIVAGSHVGILQFSTDRDTTNCVVDENYTGLSQQIAILPLDAIINGLETICWKVDVEGYEEQVLRGATKSLLSPSLKAVILEANSNDIQDKMMTAGFEAYSYKPFERSFSKVVPSSKEITGNNNLWIRDLEFVVNRCKSSPSYTVHGVTF